MPRPLTLAHRERARPIRWLLAAIFIGGGILHLVAPGRYRGIMPAYLPAHDALIFWSGLAELAGGVGLLVRRTRRLAAFGLLALLVAVFPANVEMLRVYRERGVAWWGELLLWARLPLQLLLMWGVWQAGGRHPRAINPDGCRTRALPRRVRPRSSRS